MTPQELAARLRAQGFEEKAARIEAKYAPEPVTEDETSEPNAG